MTCRTASGHQEIALFSYVRYPSGRSESLPVDWASKHAVPRPDKNGSAKAYAKNVFNKGYHMVCGTSACSTGIKPVTEEL